MLARRPGQAQGVQGRILELVQPPLFPEDEPADDEAEGDGEGDEGAEEGELRGRIQGGGVAAAADQVGREAGVLLGQILDACDKMHDLKTCTEMQ